MRIIFTVLSLILFVSLANISLIHAESMKQQDDDKGALQDKSMKKFLDKIEIYGRIAKPQTVFIIPGADPRVDGINIERRFFNDIFRKVEKSTLKKEWNREQRKDDHILW